MLENNVLGVEAGGVNGEDQSNSFLVLHEVSGSESRTTGHRGARVMDLSTTAGGRILIY